jgi:hypothetical protein
MLDFELDYSGIQNTDTVYSGRYKREYLYSYDATHILVATIHTITTSTGTACGRSAADADPSARMSTDVDDLASGGHASDRAGADAGGGTAIQCEYLAC